MYEDTHICIFTKHYGLAANIWSLEKQNEMLLSFHERNNGCLRAQ